ncbi:hypothetical protein GQX74_009540 [Glossina fuscipes]|nr:hypothetical protein GQX74_009540 [Glossina fuscipes]
MVTKMDVTNDRTCIAQIGSRFAKYEWRVLGQEQDGSMLVRELGLPFTLTLRSLQEGSFDSKSEIYYSEYLELDFLIALIVTLISLKVGNIIKGKNFSCFGATLSAGVFPFMGAGSFGIRIPSMDGLFTVLVALGFSVVLDFNDVLAVAVLAEGTAVVFAEITGFGIVGVDLAFVTVGLVTTGGAVLVFSIRGFKETNNCRTFRNHKRDTFAVANKVHKNKRKLWNSEKMAKRLGFWLSTERINGSQIPSSFGAKLSGNPGKPSTKTLPLPALLPLRWYFIKRDAPVSATTKKSSLGLKATRRMPLLIKS